MDVGQWVLLVLLMGFFLVALLRIFRAPLRLGCRVLANTALGFGALWATGFVGPALGIHLGLNLWNALIIGVLGVPGFVLLLLAEWVL